MELTGLTVLTAVLILFFPHCSQQSQRYKHILPSEFRNSIMIVSMWIKSKPLPHRQGPLLVLR